MMKRGKFLVLLFTIAAAAAFAPSLLAGSGIIYVAPGGTGDGTGWSSPTTLDKALAATDASEVWLKAGSYDATGLEIDRSVTLRGGFAGTETAADKRSLRANVTTLKSSGKDRVLTVSGDAAVSLDALAITGGSADLGGGIYNAGTLSVTRCTIKDNQATEIGGGVYNTGTLYMTNCTVSKNIASRSGGGVCGMFDVSSGTSNYIANCTFYENKTISGSDSQGGGIYDINAKIVNSIFWNNTAAGNASFNASTAYNCIASADTYSAATSSGMINSDPKLSSSTVGNGYYELAADSPAIDKGLPVGAHDGCVVPADDQRGMTRPQGSGVDIGAYEYYAATVTVDALAQDKLNTAIAATNSVASVDFSVAGLPQIPTTGFTIPVVNGTTTSTATCSIMSAISSAQMTAAAIDQTFAPANIEPFDNKKGIMYTVSTDEIEPRIDKSEMLPTTATIKLSSADVQAVLDKVVKRGGARLDPAKVRKDPSVYATDLFYVLLIQKHLTDTDTKNRYVTLVPDILSAAEAENMGILTLAPDGSGGITVTLKYYVADAWVNGEAVVQDGNLIVGDGCKNGKIVDPVWVNMVADESPGSGSSGGCAAGFGALALLAVLPLFAAHRKHS